MNKTITISKITFTYLVGEWTSAGRCRVRSRRRRGTPHRLSQHLSAAQFWSWDCSATSQTYPLCSAAASRLAGAPQVPLGAERPEQRLRVCRQIPLKISAGVLQASVIFIGWRAGDACLLEHQHWDIRALRAQRVVHVDDQHAGLGFVEAIVRFC